MLVEWNLGRYERCLPGNGTLSKTVILLFLYSGLCANPYAVPSPKTPAPMMRISAGIFCAILIRSNSFKISMLLWPFLEVNCSDFPQCCPEDSQSFRFPYPVAHRAL